MERFRDGSGLIGVAGLGWGRDLVHAGLKAMTHRGGHGAAIAGADGTHVRVARAGADAVLPRMSGDRFIGQVFGGLGPPGSFGLPLDGGGRMVLGHGRHGSMACAMAGRFTNGSRLRRELKAEGAVFQSDSDAEVLLHLIAHSGQRTRVNRLVDALWRTEGAFSLLVLGSDVLVAVRDPLGFRPLILGEVEGAPVVASEEAVLRAVGARIHREIEPGEMLIAHRDGVDAIRPFPQKRPYRCIQELIALTRPDSRAFGHGSHATREALGERLGLDAPVEADVVVGLPGDEPFAVGYGRSAGLRVTQGFYGQSPEEWAPIEPAITARRVVLVSAGLLTGAVLRKAVATLRRAGAMEVHVRVATPAVQNPCLFGVPSPTGDELAWINRPDREELASWLDASSIEFQAIQGVRGVLGANDWCTNCLGGDRPLTPEEPDDQLPLF